MPSWRHTEEPAPIRIHFSILKTKLKVCTWTFTNTKTPLVWMKPRNKSHLFRIKILARLSKSQILSLGTKANFLLITSTAGCHQKVCCFSPHALSCLSPACSLAMKLQSRWTNLLIWQKFVLGKIWGKGQRGVGFFKVSKIILSAVSQLTWNHILRHWLLHSIIPTAAEKSNTLTP